MIRKLMAVGVLALISGSSLSMSPILTESQVPSRGKSLISVIGVKDEYLKDRIGLEMVRNKGSVVFEKNKFDVASEFRYVEPEKALQRFSQENSAVLSHLQKRLELPELGIHNADVYEQALIPFVTADSFRGSRVEAWESRDASTVLEFVGALEESYAPSTFKSILKQMDRKRVGQPGVREAIHNFSSTAPALAAENSYFVRRVLAQSDPYGIIHRIDGGSAGGYSITKAISYAERHATNPNPTYRYFAGNDCANFVSQIMKAGGFTENDQWRSGNGRPTRSWSVANDFANRFGITRTWSNAADFTKYAAKGWPVGFKSGTTVKHVGFVVAKGGRYYHQGRSITDLKIAQHSGNYVGWLKNAKQNHARNWLNVEKWVTP
ncbi:amidase domain-containing protein [Arcanobacterium wilhelmae]|uniref:amidase domain-containing protein n=1 Tax=Arcanobacterium wilhelmae TaxID=1803177 RepID=UPI0024158560|nr:amidase domain-containing protein [Arcanobacterium wilhelmae]WFN90175.1 amidase domain-containing protein [Arcanobacterium wilhelmae]